MSSFDETCRRLGDALPPGLEVWIREHRLEDEWAPLLHTTSAWIASAAPPWATSEHRMLACMDLGTCFFLLDDAPAELALSRYADLERVTSGTPPDPSRPLQQAFADLFARLVATGNCMDHFLATRGAFARALRIRHALGTGTASTNAEDFLVLRQTTIYFEPWLSLWEVLGGFTLSEGQRARVDAAFVSANRWQVLENDRFSVARDARWGMPNVVALLAAERAISVADAASLVEARAESELASYVAAVERLRASSDEPEILAYLDALVRGVDGARRHNRTADPARYQPA